MKRPREKGQAISKTNHQLGNPIVLHSHRLLLYHGSYYLLCEMHLGHDIQEEKEHANRESAAEDHKSSA
jgi:hypothetical protein